MADILKEGISIPLKVDDATRAGIESAQRHLRSYEQHWKRVESVVKVATAAIAASTAAMGVVVYKAVEAANVQEKAEKALEVALGHTSQALLDQAAALQKQTTFGDEAIIGAQALIAAFVKEESQIKAATRASLDLAAAKSMDLKAAADLVSKTLGSSTNALSRYGIQVEGAVGSTARLESLTRNLAKVFGGAAAAQAQTFGGRIEQLRGIYGDLLEQMGFGITKNEEFNRALGTLAETMRNMAPAVAVLAGKFSTLASDWVRGVGIIVDAVTTSEMERIAQIEEAIEKHRAFLERSEKIPWGIFITDAQVENTLRQIERLEKEKLAIQEKLRKETPPPHVLAGGGGDSPRVQRTKEEDEAIRAVEAGRTAWQYEQYQKAIEMGDAYEAEEQARLQTFVERSAAIKEQERADLEARFNQEQELNAVRLSMTQSFFADMEAASALFGKKSVALTKAMAIPQTVISTYESAQHAYKIGAAAGGPPLGAIMAAAAMTAGLARVAAIKSQQYGAGSGAGGGSFGGGGAAPAPAPMIPYEKEYYGSGWRPGEGQQKYQSQLIINVHGDIYDGEKFEERVERATVKSLRDPNAPVPRRIKGL